MNSTVREQIAPSAGNALMESVRQRTLSIVIVSHNVREPLGNCLESIEKAAGSLEPQVIVVDNLSVDGSVEMVRERFPGCRVIASDENLGFSRANNVALRMAEGRYVLLLNPDTVLGHNVLSRMVDYMEAAPETGMVTCRLVTRDGSLDLACRRSFPSLWDGFCRASGLSALLPRSRLFARYNLTYLKEDEIHEVDAVNGAFMLVRREALKEVGPLDEDYFMYVEDLDWCYRFRRAGWKIVYNPCVTALHLKGESGNQNSREMIRHLFRSTETFFRKHYFPNRGIVGRMLLLGGLSLWRWTALGADVLRKRGRTRP